MKTYSLFIICLTLFLVPAYAQDSGKIADGNTDDDKSKIPAGLENFKFGVALGFENYNTGYYNEAETNGDERVVRVTDKQNQKLSLWLETHYLWDGFANKTLGLTHSAPGFYMGTRVVGDDSAFDAFSLGAMWSFKRTAIGSQKAEGQIAESINIGFGPVWHRTRMLADGIDEGKPLPEEFNDVKFKKGDEISWMIMVSVGF